MTLYDELGVDDDSTDEEIKNAYRKMAMKHHPDRGGDKEKFHSIQVAYETLSDADKREQYDSTGEINDDVNDNEDKVLNLILTSIYSIMESKNYKNINYSNLLVQHLTSKLLSCNKDEKKIKSRISSIEKIIENNEGPEFIFLSLNSKIEECKFHLKQVEEYKSILQQSLEISKDLKFTGKEEIENAMQSDAFMNSEHFKKFFEG